MERLGKEIQSRLGDRAGESRLDRTEATTRIGRLKRERGEQRGTAQQRVESERVNAHNYPSHCITHTGPGTVTMSWSSLMASLLSAGGAAGAATA